MVSFWHLTSVSPGVFSSVFLNLTYYSGLSWYSILATSVITSANPGGHFRHSRSLQSGPGVLWSAWSTCGHSLCKDRVYVRADNVSQISSLNFLTPISWWQSAISSSSSTTGEEYTLSGGLSRYKFNTEYSIAWYQSQHCKDSLPRGNIFNTG